jgi:hypothetical protein
LPDYTVSDRRVGCCLEPKGNGVNPQTESKISSQPPAGKESTAPWNKKKTGRRVRRDKEDPSAQSEDYLIFFVNVLCPCV